MAHVLRLLLVTLCAAMIIAPSITSAATYKLTNGQSFNGTEDEYKYAELLLAVEADLPRILKTSWEKAVKKSKFPSIETILKKSKVSGSATYNPTSKEFTISNTADGKIILEVNHKFSESKINKIIDNFAKELQKEVDIIDKKANVRPPKTVQAGSDLYTINLRFGRKLEALGYNLGLSILSFMVELDGKSNKTTNQPMFIHSYVGKNDSFPEVLGKDLYYYPLPPVFDDKVVHIQFFDMPSKKVFINMEVDKKAAPGTTFTFKVNDIRGLTKLKAQDIWPELYE